MREILFKGFHECKEGAQKAYYGGAWHDGEWIRGNLINYPDVNRAYIAAQEYKPAWGAKEVAMHAVLRETGGSLFVDPKIIGTDPWKYLFGTTGKRCTELLLEKKYADYYKKWKWKRSAYDAVTKGWAEKGVMVCDCQGLEDCFSGKDTNAKGNYANYCSDVYKGRIKDIVRNYVYGEALFCGSTPGSINHVGWVVGIMGDGEPIILHERGISHGCVIERMSKSGKDWTYRGLMDNRYEYTIIASANPVEEEPADAPDERDLYLASPMMRGEDVKKLQTVLASLGYAVGTIDGIYGNKTEYALNLFQKRAKGLNDGVCDDAMRELLGL